MNLNHNHHIFASESVSEGHPDKLCDQISDAVLDAILAQDPESRVACECLATTDYLVIAGEITSQAKVDYEQIARRVIRRIGYDSPDLGFSADTARIDVRIHEQSPNIAQGVNAATSRDREQGAGDQGLMFGFACDETCELMPAPIYYAHRIVERLAEMRHQEKAKYPFLRPDAKSQVAVEYDENNHPVAVRNLVVSHQHTPGAEDLVRGPALQAIREVIPEELLAGLSEEDFYINATGSFERGGPYGDSGLTGRKIIVDTYGGMGRHGGGAFSGKDPSKVDRSASYMLRYAAKNIVAAGLARRCEIQVSYAIGISHPLSYHVETFGTARSGLTDYDLTVMLASGKVFDLRPAAIVDCLQLKTPQGWSYEQSASYGHFGRPCFAWEKLDKVEQLRSLFR